MDASTPTTTTTPTVISKVRDNFNDINPTKGIWMPTITITRAPSSGRNPNCLYVKDTITKAYIGRITTDNHFRTTARTPEYLNDIQRELRIFANGGREALATLGKIWGSCCFCGRTLEDPESVDKGYGPVCAKHHNLPHSNRHGF